MTPKIYVTILNKLLKHKGVTYGLLAAVMYASFLLTDQYVYQHYTVNNFNFAATFTIWAAIFGLGSLLVNRYKKEFKIFNKGTALVGLIGIIATIGAALIVFGQQYTTAINASIVSTASILTTVIYSRIILKESLNRLQSVCLLMMFVGLYIAVVGTGMIKLNKGDLIIIIAMLFLGFTNAYSKLLLKNNTSEYVADFRLVAGGIFFLSIGLALKRGGFFVSSAAWWPVLAGLCSWLTLKFFYISIRYSNPNEATVLLSSHPVITPIAGVFLLSESYSLTKFIGSLLILASIYFINRKVAN